MSTVFDLDLDGQRVQDERAALNPLSPDAVEVPTFYRTGQAIGGYAMAGFARSARAGMLALSAAPIAYDALAGGTDAQDAWFEATDDLTTDAIKYWTPGAQETGAAGRLLGGVSQGVASLIAGGIAGRAFGAVELGAVGGLAGTEGLNTGAELVEKGVGGYTAAAAGTLQGAATALGAMIPGSGIAAGRVADLALTAGGNAALGIGSRAAVSGLLSANGYDAQAQQFKAFDAASIAADLVIGGAFWGMSRHLSLPQVDSALAQKNAQHYQVDSAPGIPVDAASSINHQKLLGDVIAQINRGEPVTIPEGFRADFLHRPDPLDAPMPARDQLLASARQEVESTYRAELQQQADLQVPNVADLRREMAELQRTLDGLDDTFRDRAKDFQQQGQGRKAAETSARKAIEQDRQAAQERQQEIAQTLEQNRTAEQARAELGRLDRGEPSAVLDQRSTERADAIAQGFERKPLAAGVANGLRTQREQAMSDSIRQVLADAGIAEREIDGSPESARGTPARSAGASTERHPNTAAEPEAATPRTSGGEGDTAVALDVLRSIVQREPGAVIHSGFDADGSPTKTTASDALAEIEAGYEAGVRESQSFMAAIRCMLKG